MWMRNSLALLLSLGTALRVACGGNSDDASIGGTVGGLGTV